MTTELSPPKGHGIVRVSHNLRVHALHPQDWAALPATDYWANWGDIKQIPADAIGDLDLYGWITTGFSHTVGSGADFMSSSDVGTTGGLNFDTHSDVILSPYIFGDYAHALLVGQILGYMPTSLNMECYARFAANADEAASGFGFLEAGSSPGPPADADLMAFISTDGTNFQLGGTGGTELDTGAVDDTAAHQWKIQCKGTTAEWWIDGTSQGSISLQNDLWPVCWAAGTELNGTCDPVVSWVHLWYE